MDFIYIGLIVGFFAATAGLIRFCAEADGQGRPVMNWVYWLSGARRARHLRLSGHRAVQAGALSNEHVGLAATRPLRRRPAAAREAARRLHGRGLRRPRDTGAAHRRTARAADLSRCGRRPGRATWAGSTTRWRCSGSTSLGALVVYALQRLQQWLPLNPQAMAAVSPGLVVQHRDELHHQHQLAGLRRREHDELPDADARARRAELRVGGDRHGGAGRADSRLRAQGGRRHRQLLGRPRRARRSTSCCRCRSSSRSCW